MKWKPIAGYDYEVSDCGSVRRSITKHILKPGVTRGYLYVRLSKHGIGVSKSVHRLVAAAFLGQSNGKEVNHIDGVKANNAAKNLEYVNRSENINHAFKSGLIQSGENHKWAKLSSAQVKQIKDRFASGDSVAGIACAFAVTVRSVYRILSGTRRKYQ
jgi:hypothetical protein